MRFDREPDRSPSRSPPPFHDENNNENDEEEQAELLAIIAEKEAEMKRAEELLNERMREMEATLAQLQKVNNLLEQFVILEHNYVNTNK